MKALLFDFDGVIVDSQEAHYHAFREVFSMFNISFSSEEFRNSYFGIGPYNVIKQVLGIYGIKDDIDNLVHMKDMLYRENFPLLVKPVPGSVELIKSVRIRKCIASSTSRENLVFALKELKLEGQFEFFVAREDVSRTKPSPDVYLEAVKRLGLDKSECLVIEDTAIGIEAAKIAGLKVAAITTTFAKDKLSAADYVFEDFNGIRRLIDDKRSHI